MIWPLCLPRLSMCVCLHHHVFPMSLCLFFPSLSKGVYAMKTKRRWCIAHEFSKIFFAGQISVNDISCKPRIWRCSGYVWLLRYVMTPCGSATWYSGVWWIIKRRPDFSTMVPCSKAHQSLSVSGQECGVHSLVTSRKPCPKMESIHG